MKTKEEILENRRNSPKFSTNQQFSKDQIILAMEEYADQFKTKWVSVEERLPEEGKNVIVFYGKYVSAGYIRNVQYYKRPEKADKWQIEGRTSSSVTHWMPMPEPPNT